jgi:hypothetical protein
VSFAAITPRVASERVFIVVVYLVMDSVRELFDIPSYNEGTTVSIRPGRLEQELQMVQLSATRCSKGKLVPVLN